ncbi:Glucose-repressible alcohol dehydrogenase transcriptional effector [Golovinomyces cichoracearum]|uniref:CCR4-Not complex 3'-5'-exoribonuclease subunit Ccr4 n=1 Tax=Golovinomyces cichoracearum TaxID=62708 RepID=A0A420H9L8_9PEZI|nr:Glucose-repressible alcohol dehydrogenase transcriptional effector [Golovinomyces cichoracearum]
MADSYRYSQQSAGGYYLSHNTQAHLSRHHQIIRKNTPPNNVRSSFIAKTPSPTRSPDPHSPAPGLYTMYNQSHQSQHGRVNGGGRGMPIMYSFQHQNSHQQHTQHHTNIQQDQSSHTTNGSVLNRHSNHSSSVLTNSTPTFTPSSLHNGQPVATRGGQTLPINEHWSEQLLLHKESERLHYDAKDRGVTNYFARSKAQNNKGLVPALPPSEPADVNDGVSNDLGRMSNQSSTTRRQDWHNMDLSGQGLRVLTSPLFNYVFLRELYLASNNLTQLPPSIGNLRHLTHLDASNNQLSRLPRELGMCVYLKQLLVFDNQIMKLPHELGSLFQLEMLGIEGNPLDSVQKSVIMENGTKALIHNLREHAPKPEDPVPRKIISLLDEGATPPEETIKVFSFNILSDQACTQRLYGYTPQAALSWEHRRESVLNEITTIDADFVCLQEVDTDTFKEYFSMKLAYSDYKGVFWPRSRAKTMSEKDAKNVDGCATFYKHQKYILLDKQLIDFANIAINRPDMKNQHDIFNRVMPRDHIGVVCFFENRLTGSRLILVNTHIFWDPLYADVKLIQTAILLGDINRLAEKYAKWGPCKENKTLSSADGNSNSESQETPPQPSKEYSSKTQIPLVICSDLNSTADSSVFELLARGTVQPNHPEFGGRSYGNFTKDGIDHPFSLKSAYTNLDKSQDSVPFTNYTPGFRGVIDHIWYSTNSLENISLLGQVDPEYMKTVPGFPNHHHPSDHLSLLAEFAVKGNKIKKNLSEPDFGPSNQSSSRRRG